MRGFIPNHHHSYTLCFFVVLALFHHVFSINTLSSTQTLTISSPRTIVSPGDVFELGFFRTTTSSGVGDRWYLGIWFKSTPQRTYVWIANRDKPLSNSNGTLKISYANLVLFDHRNNPVWSTKLRNGVKSPLVAELLANGNFVLEESKTNDPNRFLWQSFDFPGDTLLPEMKLGRNLKTRREKFLTSWKGPYDPSSGEFSFKLGTRGLGEFYLSRKDEWLHRTGPWNGMWFSGIPEMKNWSYVVSNFIENREEVAYTFKLTNQRIHSWFTLSSDGSLQLFTWTSTLPVPNLVWASPEDECDLYGRCAPYSYCDVKTSKRFCNCINGFVPRNVTAWILGEEFNGCVRQLPLRCGRGDVFSAMKNMKLPDTTTTIVDKKIGLKECKERCIRDCNCTGFANADIRKGGSGCVIWTGELMDMRRYVAGRGQVLYVKLTPPSFVH